jgi:glycosyltransferase involved in cell wall biosynthesis
MSRPLISILMPTLNCRSLIEESLDTIVSQAFQDIEVIISDGGSSDDTVDFAVGYLANASVKVTALVQPGSSVYGALNLAGRIAQGDWHYVLGSDDKLYDSQVFSDVATKIQLSKADVCYGNAWNAHIGQLISCGEYTLDRFATENICHQAIFYRSSKLRSLQIEYTERYHLLADWDYNLKLFSRCRFECMPLTIAIYSGTGKSSCEEDIEFRIDLGANMIKYFGARVCYSLNSYTLKQGAARYPRRGNRVLLAANRYLYPRYRSWKVKMNSTFYQ